MWLMRMAQWLRHPPSGARLRVVLGAVALCAVLYAIQLLWGWPDWLTVNGTRGMHMRP